MYTSLIVFNPHRRRKGDVLPRNRPITVYAKIFFFKSVCFPFILVNLSYEMDEVTTNLVVDQR